MVARLNQTSQVCTRITIFYPCFVHGNEFVLGNLFFLGGKVGAKVFDKTFLDEGSRRFVRQVEVLFYVVRYRLRAYLFEKNVNQLDRALQLDRAVDTHKHGEVLLLIRNVLKVVEFLQVDKFVGIQSQVEVNTFASNVQLGKLRPTEVKGFALLRNTGFNLFVREEGIFDCPVVALDFVVCLNQAGKESTGITILNILLLFFEGEELRKARFLGKADSFLFGHILVEDDAVSAKGNFDGNTHFAFVFGKLTAVLQEVGNGYQLFIIGIVNGEIVHLFQV